MGRQEVKIVIIRHLLMEVIKLRRVHVWSVWILICSISILYEEKLHVPWLLCRVQGEINGGGLERQICNML